MLWAYAFGAVGVVSAVSFAGVVTLALREAALRSAIFVLVALATGALFGDALVHLIPEAFESELGVVSASSLVMSGIVFFFVLEKFLAWHHCHGRCEESSDTVARHDHQTKPLGTLVLAADFVHNLIDGVMIGVSFLAGVPVGIATTVAVVLHEIPQEIADFGVLIHAGWSRGRALLWNFLSALSAFIGLFLAFLLRQSVENAVPLAAAFTAGAFIYIAGSDLVPELHKTESFFHTLVQIIAIAAGFGVMFLLAFLE